jgi:hypothetical protein
VCVQVCFEVEKQFFNGINTHTKKSTSTWNTRVTRDRKDNGRTTLSAYLNFFLNIWSVHQRRRRCDGKHLIDGITSKKEIRFGGCRQSCVWNASKFRPQRKNKIKIFLKAFERRHHFKRKVINLNPKEEVGGHSIDWCR